jgi:thioredoxin 1
MESATPPEPTREEIDRLPGHVIVEFGADWCPHCQAIQSVTAELRRTHPEIHYLNIEDGKGKPLGRSFRVKLWPTLVFLRDGVAIQQLVRPTAEEIHQAFAILISSPKSA